jgi:hypothetical protein
VFETGSIQTLNTIRGQQISIRNHAGHGAAPPNARNQVVEFRMQQRFAPAERNDARAKIGQAIRRSISSAGTGLEKSSNSLQ